MFDRLFADVGVMFVLLCCFTVLLQAEAVLPLPPD
jgi:hypothetical protein